MVTMSVTNRLAKLLAFASCVFFLIDGRLWRRLSTTATTREKYSTSRTASKDLRILAFGASRTWGAKLDDPSAQAYPYLLSPNATNLAIRATGPDYPSLCLYSMLKADHDHDPDTPYDVIVLEFFLDADEHLVRLAKRLRMRYPRATIVILRMWGPLGFEYVPTKTQQGMRGFLQKHNNIAFDSPEMAAVLETNSKPSDWKYTSFPISRHFQEEAARAVGAIIWEFPLPANPIHAITSTSHLFDADMVHLSAKGHARVAWEIKKIIMENRVQRNDAMEPWTLQDHCESWYETGLTTLSYSQDNRAVVMNEFNPDAHKWALEMRDPKASLVHIQNPLPYPAQLHVRYMKTTPPPGIYPTTRVSYSSNNQYNSSTILEPTGDNPHTKVHVNRVASLGVVPPGMTTLRFEAMEHNKPQPFRITGIVMSPLDEMVDAEQYQHQQQYQYQQQSSIS